MGRDYKIGLFCGLVAAVATVIWLATRPSLTAHARMFDPTAVAPQKPQAQPAAVPSAGQPNQPARQRPQTAGASEPARSEPPRAEPPRTTPTPPVASKPVEPSPPPRTHIVQNGETLSSISQQYYGSSDQWQRIAKANAIKNPNVVPVGTRLIIP